MADSATKRFLKPFMVSRDDKNSGLTHTLLDAWHGGKVRIPDDKYNELLICVATDIKNGVPLYINERRRHTFRMFLDLDILWTDQLTNIEIEEIMTVTYENFKKFFPDYINRDQFMCIVSDACPKSICVDNRSLEELIKDTNKIDNIVDNTLCENDAIPVENMKEKIWDCTYNTIFKLPDGRLFKNTYRTDGMLKHGIHAVFPHIIVTTEEALYMRESLVDALTKHFGNKFAPKGFSEVVDNAVYVNSGLRMIYSSKTRNCDVCKNTKNNKRENECNFCENGKDLSEGRPYVLKFVCNNGKIDDNTTKLMKDNMIRLLSYAIIYTSQCKVSENWKKYPGCPSYGDIKEAKTNGPPKLVSKERIFAEDKKSMKTWKSKTVVVNKDIIGIFDKHIKTRFAKQYSNIRIKSVVKDDKRYYISVDGEGSNFCLNLNPPRDHKSNRIWFSAEPDGIRVRCFCTCMTTEGRHLGLCKDFKTPPRSFNKTEISKLFPQKTPSMNNNPLFCSATPLLDSIHQELFGEPQTKKMRT